MGKMIESEIHTGFERAYHSDNTTVHKVEGTLTKRGGGTTVFGRQSWKKRWFVLDDDTLKYWDNKHVCHNQWEPLGSIKLRKSDTVVYCNDDEGGPDDFLFVLETKKRSLYMNAASEDDRNMWVQQLRNHIKFCAKK